MRRRNWCRNLCPLGTLLGLLGRLSIFRRRPAKLCADCQGCRDVCPTGFDQEILQKEECILCLECELRCKFKRANFTLTRAKRHGGGEAGPGYGEGGCSWEDLYRAIFLSRVASFKSPSNQERLIRPPWGGRRTGVP